ncbi:MAG: biotin/lipoyl-binding protein, partial [Verrucomicrobia bacterium]|nr:biotin/lipoyl-binding protein [Verrucomicrobiota bacterium]
MPLDNSSLDRLKIDRSAASTSAGRMRKWVILVLLLVVIALSGVFAVNRVARSKPIVVSLATVREETGGSAGSSTVLNASGYVMPRREATVSAKMTGKVIEVLAEEGKRVEAGQILARLDDSNIKANHKLAGAQLAASRAALGEAEASLKEASANHRRVEALILEKIETPAGLDRAEAALRIAEARVATQRANIAAAEQGLAVWTQQLEDTIIRAPFSGIVTAKNAQPGETISPMSSGGFTRTGI